MSLKTNNILVVDIENQLHGCRLTLKTTSNKKEVVLSTAEAGVYFIEDLKKAIEEIEEFNKEETKAEETEECCGIHLP